MLTAIPKPAPPAARELAKVDTVTELIGNTPLVEIRSVARGLSPGVRVLAKLEGFNPGGSVKDRARTQDDPGGGAHGPAQTGPDHHRIDLGEHRYRHRHDRRVLGYPVRLVLPSNVSEERKGIIRFFGGDIVYSDPMEGSDGAIRLCREIVGEEPGTYFKPDQYFNPMNSQAHYETTGPEIHRQTGGSVTHFVAGIGTGGTVMGTGRFLKERDPRIRVIAAEPDAALHGLEGLKHMASSIVPGIYHEEDLDLKIPVSTEDAYEMVYRLSQEEGLLVGQSSGAALDAALQIARQLTHGTVVTVFPDFGSRYMTTYLWTTWKEKLDVGNLDFSI